MRLCLIGLLITSSACSPVLVKSVPYVPKELRTPCDVEAREVVGLKDVAEVLTDYAEGLDCANGKIVAVDKILTDAEEKAK